MTVVLSVSGVLLFGVLVFICWRTGKTSLGAAAAATMFGFCLSSSDAAPAINNFLHMLGGG